MYSGVPTIWPLAVTTRLGQLTGGRFGDPEVDDLREGSTSCTSTIKLRLHIAVDDAFLMRVLHSVAEGNEQLQSLAGQDGAASQYSVIGSPLTSSIAK